MFKNNINNVATIIKNCPHTCKQIMKHCVLVEELFLDIVNLRYPILNYCCE